MIVPESLLTGAPRAGVTLVQVTLIALFGLLSWLAARRGAPALRGAILLAALVGLLLAPGLAVVAPTWVALPEWICPADPGPARADSEGTRPSLVPSPPNAAAVWTLVLDPRPADAPADAESPTNQADDLTMTPAKAKTFVFTVTATPDEPAPAARPGAAPVAPPPAAPPPSLFAVLLIVWLAGVLVFLARTLGGLVLLYRCAYRARPIREGEWTACLRALAERYAVPVPALRESPAVRSPLTLGLFRPAIVLPPTRRDWSAGERALILGHELAHVGRRDFWAGLLAELAACLFWPHPLVRWLVVRLRLEQEYAADAWVAMASGDSREYVRCLARLALERSEGHSSVALAFWRRRPEVLRRIDMLRRNPKGFTPRLGRWTTAAVAALAVAACLVVAGVGRLQSAVETPAPGPASPDAPARATTDPAGDPLPAGALARLGTTRLRHGADVTFVAFGPTPNTLLTAGRDNTVRLWDLTARAEVRRFTKPTTPPPPQQLKKDGKKPKQADVMMLMAAAGGAGGGFRVAVTPDGKTLAGAGDHVIQLWDVATGKELRQLEAPAAGLAGLLFSPDGRSLAGRTVDGGLVVWATDTGKMVHSLRPARRPADNTFVIVFGSDGGANSPGMAFSPDGKTLAAAATDYPKQGAVHSVKLWDLASGKEIRKIPSPGGVGVSAVALAPDGKLLAYGAGDVVRVCETATGKELRQVQVGSGVATLAFVLGGQALAVRGRNQQVQLWETGTGQARQKLSDAEPPRQTGGLFFVANDYAAPERRTLAVSPDGQRVAAAAGSTVRVWDAATGKELLPPDGHRRAPTALVLAQDGRTVVSWGLDRVVRRWEATTGKPLGAFAAPPGTTLAAFAPDGRTVALANADNTIRLHDTVTGREVGRLKGHANGIAALAYAPGGKVLASRGSADNTIRLYDLARGLELRKVFLRPKNNAGQGMVLILGGGGSPDGTGPGLAFSPDGGLIVAPRSGDGGPSKTLVVIDTATGKELRQLESAQTVTSFAFSPDGRSIATENADRGVTLWEVASGKQRGRLGQSAAPRPVRNPGGLVVNVEVSGLAGGLSEPGGPVGVAFSPDGRALAVGGPDRAVRLWDVGAGKELGRLPGHAGRIETIAFAPHGTSLASGADDTTILLWETAGLAKGLERPSAVELSAAELTALWGDLAGEDAAKARQSLRRLVAARQAVDFLGERLQPAARIDAARIQGWIADLDDEKFAVRRQAMDSLLKAGEQALPALRKALTSGPQLETRKRLEELIDRLTGGTLTPEQLRLVRAVEALEHIGTPEARQVLRTLADGAPGALPTREAHAALGRLPSK
jgi:WD40 repeat protein/beta-lactamase regulating signal transducer with metallopeptidase domain